MEGNKVHPSRQPDIITAKVIYWLVMVTIKLKRPNPPKETAEDSTNKEPKLKKIRIKTKNKDNEQIPKKPKLKISLKKRKVTDPLMDKPVGGPLKLKLHRKPSASPIVEKKVHKAPRLRLKPIRIPGEGYDSEASDIEDDPLIESGIILRVLPDIQVEFVKNSIESGDYSGLTVKWLGHRHAVVNINGNMYGAILVDLPTVIEVNKSVDRKNLLKTFDVSQMLICIKTIQKEDEVFTLKAPNSEDLVTKHYSDIEEEILGNKKVLMKEQNTDLLSELEKQYLDEIATKGYDYKHGLSPPLYNVRNRRFRRKMGPSEFEYAEEVVETLLRQDEKAENVTYELVDESEMLGRSNSTPIISEDYFKDADVQEPSAAIESTVPILPIDENIRKEAKIQTNVNLEDEDEDLDLAAVFGSDSDKEEFNNNTDLTSGQTPTVDNQRFETVEQESGSEGNEEEEEEEEDDDEEDEEEEDDEEEEEGETGELVAKEDRQHVELLADELSELETTLTHTRNKLQKVTNPLLRSRFIDNIKKLEKEVELKRRQFKIREDQLNNVNPHDSNDLHKSPSTKTSALDMDDEEEEEDDMEDEEEEDDEDEEEEEEEEEERNIEADEIVPEQSNSNTEAISMTNTDGITNLQENLDQNDLDMMMLFGAEGDE
ncbi:hypothetical protein NCAS_0C00920 [Naumovozyma castellii]|uniref:TAFII55 protein conserved region domain-containing protein n=1 Tax=Naumovozyma castellii TaxID=27288 RepID=G0VC73_NAUCA|nr:hypothetical protein NCAS_0C00920 [Naumovozyma castellii CBS 4309]CCC69082.1 hypothetical protein NCAS_0C00920 [Naumovozyma castellii CBS 4309]